MPHGPLLIRPGTDADLGTMTAIYAEAKRARQMLALIGDAGNAASVALHRALRFAPAGVSRDVGHKFGRWLDVVLMQRARGAGAATPPPPA